MRDGMTQNQNTTMRNLKWMADGLLGASGGEPGLPGSGPQPRPEDLPASTATPGFVDVDARVTMRETQERLTALQDQITLKLQVALDRAGQDPETAAQALNEARNLRRQVALLKIQADPDASTLWLAACVLNRMASRGQVHGLQRPITPLARALAEKLMSKDRTSSVWALVQICQGYQAPAVDVSQSYDLGTAESNAMLDTVLEGVELVPG